LGAALATIINVQAVSLDGYISSKKIESDLERTKYGLSCESDQKRVRNLLLGSTGVITGAASLISAGTTWQIRNNEGNPIHWFVFTNKGLPESLPFWEETSPRVIVTASQNGISKKHEEFALSKGVEVFRYNSSPALELYQHLLDKGMGKVLLFGGGQINQLFFDSNLVSRIEVTLCPVLLASNLGSKYIEPTLAEKIKLRLVTSQAHGDHVFLTYDVLR
jgi:5-amino-6-(5-phosphoribosylamino)uracil reductase